MSNLDVFRITKQEYARTAAELLNGEGGRRAPGRWHLRGMPVAYLASSRALCMLERMVHLSIHPRDDTTQLIAARLGIPDDLASPAHVRQLTAGDLDAMDPAWRQERNRTCLRIGVQWFRDGTHLAMRVPSAIIPSESNLVINCGHPAVISLIARAAFDVEQISIDPRITEIISEEALWARRSI